MDQDPAEYVVERIKWWLKIDSSLSPRLPQIQEAILAGDFYGNQKLSDFLELEIECHLLSGHFKMESNRASAFLS